MTQVQCTDSQLGFAKGTNPVTDPAFMPPDQARRMTNFRLTNYGAALKRLGTALTTTAAITTNSTASATLGGLYWPAKQRAYIFCAGTATTAGHVYRAPYNFPLAAAWTDLGAMPQYRPVLFSDGSDEVMYVGGDNTALVRKIAANGTTISTLGGATAMVSGLVVYNDRLWGWSGNSLYYSALSSPVGSIGGDSLGDASTGGGVIVVRTFGTSSIVACVVVNGSLVIFHDRGISVLTGWGQDDIAVQPQALNTAIGMGTRASPDAVCVASNTSSGDVAYFMTDLGMYITNGGFVRPLGTPEKPDPIAALLTVNQASVGPQTSVVLNRSYSEVWMDTGDGVWVFNTILEAWAGPFTGTYTQTFLGSANRQRFFEVVDSGSNPYLWRLSDGIGSVGTNVSECDSYFGGASAAYLDDVLPDGAGGYTGGNTVVGSLLLRRFFGKDFMWSKSWRWINVLATLTQHADPPIITVGTGIINRTFALQNIVGYETIYYLSPGGEGPYMDVTVTDSGRIGLSRYTVVSVQGFILGQR